MNVDNFSFAVKEICMMRKMSVISYFCNMEIVSDS